MGSTTFVETQVTTLPSDGNHVFKVVEIPQQKLYNGVPFPVVMSPGVEAAVASSLAELVQAHKPWLEAQLKVAGAVLFRGFHVSSATEFNDVIDGFGYGEYPFAGLVGPRTHVVGPVYTSNDNAPEHTVLFHNEMAYLEEHPRKVFFYCEVEPGSQGETPIVLGHIVHERLKKNHSAFLERLEEHGLVYIKVLPHDTDPSCPIGQSWKITFSTDDKSIAQQKAVELGVKLEWQEKGVKVTLGPVSGIMIDKSKPDEKQRTWFNSLMPSLASDVPVTLGDGGLIPPEVIEECKVILEEECVAFPWRRGDVLMLDNWAVQHARRPFTPPRCVLASFTK